jgi:hypothetical protein
MWWSGAPKRSEVRSGTQGNVGMKCEPADAGDRSPASGMHCRSSDSCQAVSSGRFAGFGGSRDSNPAFRVYGRSTLGFRRVARAAGLPFLRLRCNDLPNTMPEKCGSPIVQAVVSWQKAHERPNSSTGYAGWAPALRTPPENVETPDDVRSTDAQGSATTFFAATVYCRGTAIVAATLTVTARYRLLARRAWR